ncbi:hypothetical protein OIDMADRAFT_50804 [Oidiodendron maius Zn]|uniref:Uncharacterized protein n=1 Tax=Oidiodendron maius (strain Zn) TaxID=913774 RepID=A0A0C3HPN7_OIDMZ|nr:hypothetical protein OIDMADRAFT_50804 [Oidiodendron maius Zn]
MASPSIRQNVKVAILTVLGMGLVNLGVLIYFGVVTIPYVSPIVMAFGNSISPFTPLITPAIAYCNFKQWLHPAGNAYRATLKGGKYAASLIPQYVASVFLISCTLLKFSWIMERIYGLKVD